MTRQELIDRIGAAMALDRSESFGVHFPGINGCGGPLPFPCFGCKGEPWAIISAPDEPKLRARERVSMATLCRACTELVAGETTSMYD